ncbi:MAG: cytochrome c [Caulobacteraceae bacterium]
MNGWKLLDHRTHLVAAAMLCVVALLMAGMLAVLISLGAYNIGADSPHTKPVFALMEALRDRSVAVRARNIKAPADLGEAKRVSAGAGLYAEMCSGCHLAPGMEKTEISQGLYPQAPEFSRGTDLSAREEFWVVKHGIKMTAMPAWGRTHSDELIWDMVAFLRKLPSLSPAAYQAAVKSAPADHDEMMRHMVPMAGADHPPS